MNLPGTNFDEVIDVVQVTKLETQEVIVPQIVFQVVTCLLTITTVLQGFENFSLL